MKIISWNVNGIRAVAKKGFDESLKKLNPDVLCLQETKAQDDQVAEVLKEYSEYTFNSNSAEKKGYSGTAILSKKEPLNITRDIGIAIHDTEGRVITAEFDKFYLTTVYVPNSGQGLVRLDYRQGWDKDLLVYLKDLEKKKPVIVCGDLNVAHTEIDIKNSKSNYNKTAGYTQVEIDGMDNFINAGFVDTFRHLHPDEIAYSWWSYRFNARANNVGWRIDYFLTSKSIISNVSEAFILPDFIGSDHCPVGVEISLN
ncbi:exodeoxyribonuclease III [Sphingobacteriaceae bacterium AH-315-L07]|nr:exodeoxyribonuclease III [Bacteroidia bacterium]MBN4052156.1 exodeoxyribonuclease III [Sphingobacteriaceae bacterium AH-315-L07]